MQESGKSTWTNGDNVRHQSTSAGGREHLDLKELCARLHRNVTTFLEEEQEQEELKDVQEQTRISLRVLEQALQSYSLSHLCFSFNGGKDCLVLLVLFLVAIHKRFHASNGLSSSSDTSSGVQTFPKSLTSIYIVPRDPFPQVDDFVHSSSEYYHLDLYRSSLPMKQAFEEYLDKHKEIKAIFVGTRRADPHGGKLEHFHRTDSGWPDFVRIHPVITWQYHEIWTFIRHFEIPYCTLYDMGYTSLGGQSDTHPNPALRIYADESTTNKAEQRLYRPAYELVEDADERLGRDGGS